MCTAASKANRVCGEPKIFVGQIPLETSKDEIHDVFSSFGNVKTVNIMSTAEGRSKGCAMVLFDKWSQAEVAIEACNGKSFFGTNRTLVVNLADPPRRGGGVPPIAPKTLFVGQVPKTIEDDEVRALFEPFGEIVEFHVSRKGSVSGCAFVKFSYWSEAENAMEALHSRHTLPGAKNPLVVKFADAKTKDSASSSSPANCLLPLGIKPHPLLDMDWQNGTKLAAFQGAITGEQFSMNDNSSWQQSSRPLAAAATAATGAYPYQAPNRRLGFNGISSPPTAAAAAAAAYGMNASPYFSVFGNGTQTPPHQAYSTSSAYATMVVGGGNAPLPLLNNAPGGGGSGIMSAASVSGIDFNLASNMPESGVQTGSPRGKLGPGISDPRAHDWKLFVGQVPFDCSEQDLWPIFSNFGEILELVILRSEGRSKGCAFVTYDNKETAESAATRLNGQVSLPNDRRGKRLVVRFAEKRKNINWSNFTEEIQTK
eukprot:g8431.t1